MESYKPKAPGEIIFIISNEAWGDQWFIKHHYANELAKTGFMVYFINPVNQWSLKEILNFSITKEAVSENLEVVTYSNTFPVRLFTTFFTYLNDWINAHKLKKLRKDKHLILWQFDPFRFTKNFFSQSFKIYHISDHYADLPLDNKNVKNADLLICTSKSVVPHYRKFEKKVIHVPHGVSDAEFTVQKDATASIQNQYGRYVFHAGSINDRLDIELIKRLVNEFPSTNFVFAGPNKLLDIEKRSQFGDCLKSKNFHHIGTIPGDEIKNYVHASVACLLCYEFSSSQKVGTVSSSLKVLNYLAQKRIIISSLKIEYDELIDRIIFCAHNYEKYAELVSKAINSTFELQTKEIDMFLSSRRYSILLKSIFKHIN